MIIEGKNNITEAIASGKNIDKLYVLKGYTDKSVQAIIDAARDKNARIVFLSKEALDSLTPNKHQNVVAEVSDYEYSSVEDILAVAREKAEKVFILVLDGMEDPHNLGSVIRTAETAGVHGIIIPKVRAVGVNDTAIRVSSGAIHHVKIARVTNVNDAIRKLKDNFINIFAADMSGESIYGTDLNVDLAIVIGGEGLGVKPLTLKLADKALSIPVRGKVNSLNASVAAGVAAYEVVRQRYYNE
jgi:23S rRNA (guanosine2251-2'-O)-methyltransferase